MNPGLPKQAVAKDPNDLERLFVERANASDIDGIVALYESNAVISGGDGEIVEGIEQIREFLADFLSNRPPPGPSAQSPAVCCGDIALTSSRLENGDVTAEIARRQPDGSWRWVVDNFALVKGRRGDTQ